MPYARILMEDGKPVLRTVTEHRDTTITNDTPLDCANLLLLMKEGMNALVQIAQDGKLPGFIEQHTKPEENIKC
jgi:hypothetical protein